MGHKKVVRIDPLTMPLPAGGVDSHAHLDGEEFDADREEMLSRAKDCGIAAIGNVFLDPMTFAERSRLFASHPEVFFILGLHPCDGQKCDSNALEVMRDCFAREPRLKAVGEIGLDFHWQDCPRELQFVALEQQIGLARELGKPIVIHCREAEPECLAFLEARNLAGYPLLWHCFGGAPALAKRIVDNGWHLSIPGPVTYPANAAMREAIAMIPADRLLMETDAPYLSPVPWRGQRNEPAYTVFTIRAMAEARQTSPEELWQTCGQNAIRFFGL